MIGMVSRRKRHSTSPLWGRSARAARREGDLQAHALALGTPSPTLPHKGGGSHHPRGVSSAPLKHALNAMPLLEIENLTVEFPSRSGTLRAVDGVSLTLDKGEVLGIVGESGSGKSVGMLAVMGLVPFPGRVQRRQAAVRGTRPAAALSDRERRALTGKDVAMIFQEPTTSLNPSLHDRLPARSRRCACTRAWTARRRGGA